LQKNISIRRNAQKLAKNGQLEKAVAAYKPLLASGSADPYDHLYVGDLYVKMRKTEEAITQYEAAIDEYQRLGFHRNGVALCRKILRIDSTRYSTHRRLGDLYLAEELLGDALNAFATFLQEVPEREHDSDAFRDVVACLITHVPNRADMAIQLAGVLNEVNREQDAVEMLLQSYEAVNKTGDKTLSKILKNAILEVNPAFSETMDAIQESGGGDVLEPPQMDEASMGTPVSSDAGENDSIVTDLDLSLPEDPPVVVEEANAEISLSSRMELDLETVEATGELVLEGDADQAPERDLGAFGEVDLDRSAQEDQSTETDSPAALKDNTGNESAFGEIDLSDALEESAEWSARVGPAGNLANPKRAALQAIEAEQWTCALSRVEEWLEIEADSREALDCLIQSCRGLKDHSRLVKALILKGDLLIDSESYEAASPLFNEVIELDPENEIAQRRVARFAEMGILTTKTETDSADSTPEETDSAEPVYEIAELDESEAMAVPQVLADKNAMVAVQSDSPGGKEGDQQEWMEIGALLEEFKAGVKDLVDKDDFQAHYDLALSHMEMELIEEALEEFDTAISSSDCPQHMLIRFKELRGNCYSRLSRHREAIFEYREALAHPEVSSQDMPGLKLMLAKELNAVGDVDEARECLQETIAERPDFSEALAYLESLNEGAA
jgi:tetratricopeptide (TPR) repeat protein